MPNHCFRRIYSEEESFIDLKHAINSIDLQKAVIHICSMQNWDVRWSRIYFEQKYKWNYCLNDPVETCKFRIHDLQLLW